MKTIGVLTVVLVTAMVQLQRRVSQSRYTTDMSKESDGQRESEGTTFFQPITTLVT